MYLGFVILQVAQLVIARRVGPGGLDELQIGLGQRRCRRTGQSGQHVLDVLDTYLAAGRETSSSAIETATSTASNPASGTMANTSAIARSPPG